MNWPQPENSKDVSGFLGLTSYYRKFIEHYAHIVIALYTIGTTPKGEGNVGRRREEWQWVRHTPFAWDRESQNACDTLKYALCNAPFLARPDPEAKYCLYINASPYALGAVLTQMQDKTEEVVGYFICKLHDEETWCHAYDRELLGIRDAMIYWKFNLHRAKQPFLLHTDHATLRWFFTQPHLTIHHMDILPVLQNYDWEVKHIPSVKNQVAVALSHHLDSRREQCNLITVEVTAAGKWVDDIKAGIIDDEWFGPIAHCLANPSPCPLPSTASTKEHKLWVAAQRFYLEENRLLWLCGDLEKTQVNNTAGAEEKEEDRKGSYVRTVVYCKNDAATNPTWSPCHSSRGTLRCWPNVLTYEWLVFVESYVVQYPAIHCRLWLVPSN